MFSDCYFIFIGLEILSVLSVLLIYDVTMYLSHILKLEPLKTSSCISVIFLFFTLLPLAEAQINIVNWMKARVKSNPRFLN